LTQPPTEMSARNIRTGGGGGSVKRCRRLSFAVTATRPPMWSIGQPFWLLTQRSRVRFPALRDFLSSSGLERGPLSPCESKWGATWKKSSGSGLENWD
jgi:hypothetical protein